MLSPFRERCVTRVLRVDTGRASLVLGGGILGEEHRPALTWNIAQSHTHHCFLCNVIGRLGMEAASPACQDRICKQGEKPFRAKTKEAIFGSVPGVLPKRSACRHGHKHTLVKVVYRLRALHARPWTSPKACIGSVPLSHSRRAPVLVRKGGCQVAVRQHVATAEYVASRAHEVHGACAPCRGMVYLCCSGS